MRELENFAVNLKAKRTELGLTQTFMEQETGISPTSICQLEREKHRPSLQTAILIAKELGCSLDELCGMQVIKNKG